MDNWQGIIGLIVGAIATAIAWMIKASERRKREQLRIDNMRAEIERAKDENARLSNADLLNKFNRLYGRDRSSRDDKPK